MRTPHVQRSPGRVHHTTPDPGPAVTEPLRSEIRVVVILAVLIGVVLRAGAYLGLPPLWGDEGLLLVNIVRPLDDVIADSVMHQSAPPGFLALQRAAFLVLGMDLWALRLLPFLASAAAVPLLWLLARSFLPGVSQAVAVGLFALAPYHIAYATVFKQYALDSLVAIVIALLAIRCLDPGLSRGRGLRIGAAGGLLALFSQPAVFLLPGMGLGALYYRHRRRLPILPLLWVAVFWASGVALVAVLSVKSLNASGLEFMAGYWTRDFLPLPVTLPAIAEWGRAVWILFRHPVGLFHPLAGVAAAVLALVLSRRGERAPLVIVSLPIVLALVASMLRVYPFSPLRDQYPEGRLFLFAVPALVLLMGAAIGELLLRRPPWLRATGAALGAVLVFEMGFEAAAVTSRSFEARVAGWADPDVRPALEHLRREYRAGDRVLADRWISPTILYYAARPALLTVPEERLDPVRLEPGRTWMLFGYADLEGAQEVMDRHGTILDSFSAGRYHLYLVDGRSHELPDRRLSDVTEFVAPSGTAAVAWGGWRARSR